MLTAREAEGETQRQNLVLDVLGVSERRQALGDVVEQLWKEKRTGYKIEERAISYLS